MPRARVVCIAHTFSLYLRHRCAVGRAARRVSGEEHKEHKTACTTETLTNGKRGPSPQRTTRPPRCRALRSRCLVMMWRLCLTASTPSSKPVQHARELQTHIYRETRASVAPLTFSGSHLRLLRSAMSDRKLPTLAWSRCNVQMCPHTVVRFALSPRQDLVVHVDVVRGQQSREVQRGQDRLREEHREKRELFEAHVASYCSKQPHHVSTGERRRRRRRLLGEDLFFF